MSFFYFDKSMHSDSFKQQQRFQNASTFHEDFSNCTTFHIKLEMFSSTLVLSTDVFCVLF